MGHATPVQLAQQVAESFREHRDLDFFQRDRHDPAAIACLQEERAIARVADRAGDETLGWIEDVATSRHVWTLYRFRPRPAGRPRDQETLSAMVCQPRAPSGAGRDGCSVWTWPVPSVARTLIVCGPGVASQAATHWTQVVSEMGVESVASCHSPSIA